MIKPVAWGWNLPGKNIRVENHFVDAKPDNGTRDVTTVRMKYDVDFKSLILHVRVSHLIRELSPFVMLSILTQVTVKGWFQPLRSKYHCRWVILL